MTDNTQELDEILDFIENYGVSASCDGFDPHKSRSQAKQALLDWHNKQIEAVLDRIEARKEQTIYADFESGSVEGWTGVPVSAIEAERNLKTGKKILPGQKERN